MTRVRVSSRTSEASVGIYFHRVVTGHRQRELDPDTRASRTCGMPS